MTLYEIRKDYLDALNNIEVNEDGEVLNIDAIEQAEGAFLDKAESVAIYIKNLTAEAKAIKEEEKAQASRRISLEKKIDRLTQYLDINLRDVGRDDFKTAKVEVTYRASERLIVDDESIIPDDYKELVTEMKVSKDSIKRAIKAGAVVEGAHIEKCKNIRVK